MSQLKNNSVELELNNKIKNKNDKVVKNILLWIIHNPKFLFLPGYCLEDLHERQGQYELIYNKKNNIRRFKSPLLIIGISIIIILFTLAVFQHWISPYTYREATMIQMGAFKPPSLEHPLGQTYYGFDILARLIFGTRTTLLFALTATLFAGLFGIIFGAISAYFGKWLDLIIMHIMDIILSFPCIVLAITYLIIYGTNLLNLIIVYSIIGIPYFARLIRTDVLKEKELPYISAAKTMGAGNFRIIFRHILPNCIQNIIVTGSFNISKILLSFAGLAFLRYGETEWVEWGYDISVVIFNMIYAPWALIFPLLMICLSILGFLLIGDGLRDATSLQHEKL